MSQIIVMILLDSLMIGLLVTTVYYCFKLNTRVKVLQDSKSEFRQLIEKFDSTTQRAQESIEDLQNISQKVHEQLSSKLDKANFLADDLAFMIEKGGKLADKMEEKVTGRAVATQKATPGRVDTSKAENKAKMFANAERAAGGDAAARKKASLEAVLDRVADKGGAGAEGPRLAGAGAGQKRRGGGTTTARLRSKAEQELYEAMKSGNN